MVAVLSISSCQEILSRPSLDILLGSCLSHHDAKISTSGASAHLQASTGTLQTGGLCRQDFILRPQTRPLNYAASMIILRDTDTVGPPIRESPYHSVALICHPLVKREPMNDNSR